MDQWLKKFGIGKYLKKTQSPKFNSKSGSHKIDQSQLEKLNLSKIEMNFDLLLDFHIMINARNVIWDGYSLFSKMADSLSGFKGCYFDLDVN